MILKHQFVLQRNVTKVAQALECDKRKIKKHPNSCNICYKNGQAQFL